MHSHPKPASRATGKKGGTGIAVIEVLVILGLGFAVGARGGLGWPLYDAMFLAAVLSIGSTAIHSGVVSGSFEFGEILMMTIVGRIGLFIGGTILPPASLSCAYYSRSSPSSSATR